MKTISKILAIILFFSFTESIMAQKKTPLEILGIKMLKKQTVKGKPCLCGYVALIKSRKFGTGWWDLRLVLVGRLLIKII
jgi:hypothetical protein